MKRKYYHVHELNENGKYKAVLYSGFSKSKATKTYKKNEALKKICILLEYESTIEYGMHICRHPKTLKSNQPAEQSEKVSMKKYRLVPNDKSDPKPKWVKGLTGIGSPLFTYNEKEALVFDDRIEAACHPSMKHSFCLVDLEEIEA